MKRRQLFRAQASKSQTGSSARRFTNSGPVLPFNPASIAGCQVWFDAADTSSILVDSSSNVSLWIDKSNTGTTAIPTRGASANQITYVTVDGYRGIYINNNASVVYNSSTYSQLTVQSNFQNTTDYSIFAVVNLSNVTSGELQTIYGNVRGASGERTPNFGAGATLEFNLVGENRMINSSFIGSGRLQTALISSSSALTAYTNTTAYASVTNGLTRPSTDVGPLPSIGGPGSFNDNRFANGYFHEILVYNSVLTTIQRQKVEGYLASKWGLQSSLPSNHPYKTTAPTYEEPVFLPTLISGSQLWLDGMDTSSMTFSGSRVTGWTDKSGKGFNVATSSGATGPVYNSTTKELQFVSGNSNSFTIPQGFGDALVGKTFSFFFIGRRTVNDTYVYFLSGATSGGNQNLFIGFLSNKMEIGEYGPYASADIPTFNSPDPMRLYYYDIQTSTSANLLMNGNSLSTTVSGDLFLTSFSQPELGRRYGGGAYHDFNLSEMVVFSPALSETQRKRVEGHLIQKWGLQSSLPANHPYKTIAPTGIPKSITIQSVSALFTASNNSSLSIPASSVLTLGTNDHTIEFWIYQTSRNQYAVPFIYGNTTSTATNNYYMDGGSDYLGFVIGNGSGGWAVNISGGTVPNLNTWNHYAIVRRETTFTFYVNGTSRGSATSSINITAQGDVFKIGNSTIYPINGYISNFRLVNGTAVYTSNFTPPTSPLTAIPNTQLLIQGLVDRSPNAFTVTNNGSVALSTSVSPFV
jgi:hypothetical protein